MGKVSDALSTSWKTLTFDDLWKTMESGQLQPLLDLATRMACELTHSDSSLILLKAPDGEYSRYASVYRAPEDLLHYVVNMSQSIGNYTMMKSHPVLIDDYSSHPRKVPLLEGFGYKQVLSVPITWRDTTFGALNVHSLRQRAYGSEHVEQLTRISRVVAVGLYHHKVEDFTIAYEKMFGSLTQLDRLADRARNVEEVVRDMSYIVNDVFPGKSVLCWRHPGSGTIEVANSAALAAHDADIIENIVRTALKSDVLVDQPLTLQFGQGQAAGLVTLFPLAMSHLPLGALCVFSEEGLNPAQTHVGQMLTARIAHLLGHLLLGDSSGAELTQVAKSSDIQRMVEVIADLGQVAPLQRPSALARRLREYFGADASGIYLWDQMAQPERLTRLASTSQVSDLPAHLFIHEPIWRELIASNRPIAIAHLNNPRAQSTWTPFQLAGLNSLLAISLAVQGQTFVVALGWVPPMGFGSREKSLLRTFLDIGRVLLAEYCRERYYREQIDQAHDQLMKVSSQLDDMRVRLRYFSELVQVFDQADPLTAALEVIQQVTQRTPRLEDGLGHVLYGMDHLDYYYGVSVPPELWSQLKPHELVWWEQNLLVLLTEAPTAPIVLVVPDAQELMHQPACEYVQSALPVIAEALRHSLSFRHHVQLNRTDTLLSLAGQESEREFHLKQRALNIPSAEYYRVGILGSRHPQSAAFLLDLLEELETHEPDLLFFLYKDRVLVLFPSTNPGKCSQAEQVIERVRLHPLFSSLAFALGISTAARTLAKLSQQIDEAEKAWDSAQAQREPSLFYDDLNIFSVLVNSSSIVPISAFIQRMLNPLIEYDREHESNLLLTLKQYLDSGGVLQDTANALFLHVNSLKYRLRKISSLLNVSLDDPTVRLNLQMCFRFMEVMDGANAKPPLAAPQALTP